jgi:hypothetical protein
MYYENSIVEIHEKPTYKLKDLVQITKIPEKPDFATL